MELVEHNCCQGCLGAKYGIFRIRKDALQHPDVRYQYVWGCRQHTSISLLSVFVVDSHELFDGKRRPGELFQPSNLIFCKCISRVQNNRLQTFSIVAETALHYGEEESFGLAAPGSSRN